MAEGVFDLTDTLSYGLERCCEARWITVHRSPGYANNAVLTRFGERYYCMWQESEKDEDTPDTGVYLSTSTDGESWGEPAMLAGPTEVFFASPGGWLQRGDSLVAIINYTTAADRSLGGNAYYVSTVDGKCWSEPRPMLMADGSPVEGIFEQDPLLLESGRTVGAVHFRPGAQLCPVYTDDPSGVRGWTRAVFPDGDGKPIEPSQYLTRDGRLVMFMRDQNSSFVKLVSLSENDGESWTAPCRSTIPDSRSKQCAGNLPDGTAFWAGNPTGCKSRRVLAIAFSDDSYVFDRAYLLAGISDLPPRRNEGRYKTLGYNYPKATVISDTLWLSLTVNKEDVVLIKLPPNP